MVPSSLLTVLLSVVCLCGLMPGAFAQQGAVARPNIAEGGIAGVLKDPSGAVVAGARIEVRRIGGGFDRSTQSGPQGRFTFAAIPTGHYRMTVWAAGFEPVVLADLSVAPGKRTTANVVLRIPKVNTDVEVRAPGVYPLGTDVYKVTRSEQARSGNAADLLRGAPGVSLRGNGALASVPMLYGLGDERVKLVVNGMTVSNACPNHMNPPLTYIAPSSVDTITVMAGITPVSLGGDSLGGTVMVQSLPPVFAAHGKKLRESGAAPGFYRSNGQAYGGSVSEWVAGHSFGAGYTGSWSTTGDYTDGSGHIVTSTYAEATDHALTLAARGAGNRVVLRAGFHRTPFEGFVNERMDLVRNDAVSLNLDEQRALGRGTLDARGFWQNTAHSMDIGHDKSTFPVAMNMRMNDHGTDLGYTVKIIVPLSARHTLRVGNELHRFVYNDTWPAMTGTTGMGMGSGSMSSSSDSMGPDSFLSINNGRRTRLGTYAEVLSRWNARWTTEIGARNDTVWSNTGPVHGYSSMQAMDAAAFNAANRARTDVDADATAMVRYTPTARLTLEAGYARKTRAPSLYECYAWSTDTMISSMIGWFGDGNSYVGNLALKPEIAHTVSGTVWLHGRSPAAWEIRFTPYSTHVQDYIDVNTLMTMTEGMSTFAQLQFANHNAEIYGGDLSADGVLWNTPRLGRGRLNGTAGWLHGERLDSHTGLYQMMPPHLRLRLNETFTGALRGLRAEAGMEAFNRKSNVDPHRFEPPTPGYTLFSLRAAFRRGPLRMSAGVDNLLNKDYELPLGGVNMDDFLAGMEMGRVEPVTGRGRSADFGMALVF